MFLDQITLTNFKCFQKQPVRLARITLLLGANSSGKSSLIYAILGALQSDHFPLLLSLNGSYVDMGDFRAVSHMHKDHKIGISLRFRGHPNLGTIKAASLFSRSSKTRMPVLDSLDYEDDAFQLRVAKRDRSRYEAQWSYSLNAEPTSQQDLHSEEMRALMQTVMRVARKAAEKAKAPRRSDETFDIEKFLSPPAPSGTFSFGDPIDFMKAASESGVRFTLMPHISGVISHLSGFANSFNYVGSFREEPSRTYYQVSQSDLKIKRGGQNYIQQIGAWEQRKAAEYTALKTCLRKLKLLQDIRTSRLTGGRFEVKVRPFSQGPSASLSDVGFGISQLLPILVADLQLKKGALLAISQPEIHLHPSAQAELADFFVARCRNHQRRYVIETHSEYLLHRLRLLVVEGTIAPEDLSILFLKAQGLKAESYEIVFTKDGRIEGAPKDFFQTYMLDVMNIAMKAAKE